ncbi:MAG: EI24 domain-containing protein [Deltaproteobacteria bacterium]|nr:EI24 domain-containing protein [Deltaproteobacteria bacterium]
MSSGKRFMSRVSQFLTGFKFLGRGFGFLLKHPSLWPLVIIPWILAFLLLALSWGLFIHYYTGFYQFLLSHIGLQALPEAHGFLGSLSFAGLWIVKQFLKLLLFLLGLILLSILSFVVYLILSAPFLDLLSGKVTGLCQISERSEREGEAPTALLLEGATRAPIIEWGRFFKSIGQAMWVETLKALLFLLIPILLLVLNLIPAVGGLLYAILTGLFGMWALGFVSFDFPMGHQLFSFKKRLDEARHAKYYLMGFGLPFLIPFAPLLLQPPMVVGGTLLYHFIKDTSKNHNLSF